MNRAFIQRNLRDYFYSEVKGASKEYIISSLIYIN